MTRIRALGALALALVAVAAPAQPRAEATEGGYEEYVALGDSWSADVFTSLPHTEFVPLDCAQSATDYPHQVAARLGVSTFRDATCGGATTDNFTVSQSLPLGGINPPQFSRLSPETDLVTVGIGMNDIKLAESFTSCLSLLPVSLFGFLSPLAPPCSKTFTAGGTDVFQEAIATTEPKLSAALREIHRRSPRADIFLVNYLNGIPATGRGCWPVVPITDVDTAYLQRSFLAMNAMLERVAAADAHTRLVDTYTPTVGHDWCQPPGTAYVEGLIPLSISNPLLLAFPLHPNQLGADAQARVVTDAIRHR